MDLSLECRTKIIKILEENISGKFLDIALVDIFWI